MRRPKAIFYANSEAGVTPDNAVTPWTLVSDGSPTVSTTDDGWLLSAGSGELLCYTRAFFATDVGGTSRANERLDLQCVVEMVTNGACVGLWLSDGVRELGVNIDTTLGWQEAFSTIVSPAANIVIKTSHAAQLPTVYHLIKHGSERWELKIDGVTVATLPYDVAVGADGYPARATFGVSGYGGASSARFQAPEASCNLPLPPQWKVDKAAMDLHPSLQARFGEPHRALLRAIVGEFEHGNALLMDTDAGFTAGRVTRAPYYYIKGDVAPRMLDPAWTETGGDATQVVNQRVRIYGAGPDYVDVVADLENVQAGTAPVWFCRSRFVMPASPAYTVGTGDVICFPITLDTPEGWVSVGLAETYSSGGAVVRAVTLAEGDHSSGLVSVTDRYWTVDIYRDFELELLVIGGDTPWAVLLVDGIVVDFCLCSDLTSTPSGDQTATLSAGHDDTYDGDAWLDVWDAEAGVYGYDPSRRAVFEQLMCEDLIFVGGCESNAILDAFARHRWGMLQIRGTTRGILVDVWRLTCTQYNYVLLETSPSSWALDLTWPDATPVWLDAPDDLLDVYVEVSTWPPNFTLSGFMDLLARYIVPMSVIEHQFWLCLIARATASISAGSGVNVAVESSAGFEVDDTITLRTFSNGASETCTITAVPDATHITLGAVSASYSYASATPPILRKVIRST